MKKSCYNYENAFTKSSYTVEAIEITNLSNEDYLSWIDFDNIYCKSQKMILNDFFYKRNGDFISRYLKYSDNSLILSNYFFPLNNQFLIRIGSGETFIYKILKNKHSSTYYSDRIVIVKRGIAEQYIGDSLSEKCFMLKKEVVLYDDRSDYQ